MRNGTMFHDLINYKEESFYQKNNQIQIYTKKEKQTYEIISASLSKVYKKKDNVFKYYKYYGNLDQTKYYEYIKNIKDLSLYKIKKTSSYPNELIKLSTCEYTNEKGRLVVATRIK